MSSYKKLTLTEPAKRYLAGRLGVGGLLAKFLLRHVDLTEGEVFTFLPADSKPHRIQDFSNGGVAKAKESVSCLVGLIREFLRSDSRKVVLFEDELARKGDPCVAKFGTRMMFHGDVIYHYLTHEDLEPERIAWTIIQADSPHLFIAVMTTTPPLRSPFGKSTEIRTNMLRILAKAADQIVVGAYDGEGFLIWGRRSARAMPTS